MSYVDYLDRLHTMPSDTHFLKLAEERKERRSLAKDLALVGGGTAIGAGLGYGSAALINKRYGDALRGMSPQQRLRIAVPASAGIGGLLALTHVLRQRAERRNERS